MNALRTGPVAATFARLHHLDEYLAAEVGRPEGDGWYALDTVVDDGHLDAWLESLVANNGGQRDVAGAYLGSWLAGALVSVPVSALVLERRVPHLGAGVWVHRHSDGWFDRVAFASAGVDVLVDDRVATRQEHLRRRPNPFPVSWSGGEALFQVKGTCCLYYKTQDGPLDPDGDCYCTTCPFRYDDDRLARLRRHLEGDTP